MRATSDCDSYVRSVCAECVCGAHLSFAYGGFCLRQIVSSYCAQFVYLLTGELILGVLGCS